MNASIGTTIQACVNSIKTNRGSNDSPIDFQGIFNCVITASAEFVDKEKKAMKVFFGKQKANVSGMKSFKKLVEETIVHLYKQQTIDFNKKQLREPLNYLDLLPLAVVKGSDAHTVLKRLIDTKEYIDYLPKRRFPTATIAVKYADKLKKIMLTTQDQNVVRILYLGILLFIRGSLFCDVCGQWKNGELLFETMRCIFDSKFLLKLKDKHIQEKQWDESKKLYEVLFSSIFEDILPTTDGIIGDVSAEVETKCW